MKINKQKHARAKGRSRQISFLFTLLSLLLITASCDSYLDKMPDNRTELDTQDKIKELLVSAYPTTHYAEIAEMMSDNTDEMSNTSYTPLNILQEEEYKWQDATYEEDDSPFQLWNSCYSAIASANAALQAIDEAGNPSSLDAARGEALVCRAYSHWVLTSIFCKAYSPVTSTTDLGVPYTKVVETTVSPQYNRGTVAEDYQNIIADLEEGIPLLTNASYDVPAYHFTKKAAEAFAARVYLYYVQPDGSNYDKVISYAHDVLTDDPLSMLRDWTTVGALSPNDNLRANQFISTSEKANLLLISTYSLWVRIYGPYTLGMKYCHGNAIAYGENNKRNGVWGSYGNLRYRIYQYSNFPKVIMDKFGEYFEFSDRNAGIGYAHEMFPALTSDETMLNMIEAYVMKKDYTNALSNFNTWVHNFTSYTGTVTMDAINNLYGKMAYYTPTSPTAKKRLNPDFTVEEGDQETFLQCLLHCRRIMTLHEGLRWQDVKRFGMKIYRRTVNGTTIQAVTDSMDVNDPRRAVQLPASVITAGLEANPR